MLILKLQWVELNMQMIPNLRYPIFAYISSSLLIRWTFKWSMKNEIPDFWKLQGLSIYLIRSEIWSWIFLESFSCIQVFITCANIWLYNSKTFETILEFFSRNDWPTIYLSPVKNVSVSVWSHGRWQGQKVVLIVF